MKKAGIFKIKIEKLEQVDICTNLFEKQLPLTLEYAQTTATVSKIRATKPVTI